MLAPIVMAHVTQELEHKGLQHHAALFALLQRSENRGQSDIKSCIGGMKQTEYKTSNNVSKTKQHVRAICTSFQTDF